MNDIFSKTQSTESVSFDAGLQSHMQRVYNRMTVGVLITALVSYAVSSSPALMALFMGGPQAYIIMFAPLAVIWFGFNPITMSSSKLKISFILLSVLYGISFSTIFVVFTGESIAKAFFMAVSAFAGLSVFGYTTKKDLTGLGTFAVMAVMGVVIASIIGLGLSAFTSMNMSGMYDIISIVGLLAFAGVTAWQTQATKEMYSASAGDEYNSRMAWSASLNLYISFIAIFQYILHFVGSMRGE